MVGVVVRPSRVTSEHGKRERQGLPRNGQVEPRRHPKGRTTQWTFGLRSIRAHGRRAQGGNGRRELHHSVPGACFPPLTGAARRQRSIGTQRSRSHSTTAAGRRRGAVAGFTLSPAPAETGVAQSRAGAQSCARHPIATGRQTGCKGAGGGRSGRTQWRRGADRLQERRSHRQVHGWDGADRIR